MPQCCIKGCDSSEYIGDKDITLFSFPTHNGTLLKTWLNIMDVAGWNPSNPWICSMHFTKEDIQRHSNGTKPTLKPTSVPTIFPAPEADAKVPDRPCYPRILMTLPLQPPSPAKHVGVKDNLNFPITQSSPLILVPTQYILQCQGQFPFPLSAQLSGKINSPPVSQNSQTNSHNPGHFGQLPPTSNQKFLVISHPSQTVVQNSENSSEVSGSQDPVKSARVSPANARNSARTCRILQPNDRRSIQIPLVLEANGQNPAQPARFVQKAAAQNSTEMSEPSRGNAHNPSSPSKLSQPNDGNRIQMFQISQANAQRPAQPTQIVEHARVRDSTATCKILQVNAHNPAWPCKFLRSNDQNQKEMLKSPHGNCRNSTESVQYVQQAGVHSPFGKSVGVQYSDSNDKKEARGMPDRSTALSPVSRKILPAPERSFAPKSKFVPRVLSETVSKPDILIVPMCRNGSTKRGSELSVPLRYPDNKRPTLRITINKRYNVPPESKISAVTGEKENASTGGDSVDKRITIENTSANKSVTFRLDHRTGEIHLENSNIVETSKTNRRSRRRRMKRKSQSIVRKTSSTIRKRSTRTRRIVKKTEIPAMFLSTRASKGSRVTRASDTSRQ